MNTTYRVLVVDGKSHERDKIRVALGSNIELFETHNELGAQKLLEEKHPDCVLLEHTSSLNLLDQFVASGTAVILLTEEGDAAAGVDALRKGAQDYFVKSAIGSGALLRVVTYACERNRLIQQNHATTTALRESEQRFNDIAQRVDLGLWVRSPDGRTCLYSNPALKRIWGRSQREINQIGWSNAVHPDDRDRARACFLKAVEARSDYVSQYRITRPDGEIRFIINSGYPVLDDNGSLLRIAGIVRDVTEERALEEELRMAHKLEAVGQLTAGIAHEINTPSQYVSDNVAYLARAVEDIEPLLSTYTELVELARKAGVDTHTLTRYQTLIASADLEYVLEEVPMAINQSIDGLTQIKTIVRAMKDFSHPTNQQERIDLNRAIESTAIIARNEWKYVAKLDLDLEADLPLVLCELSSINQVILNLVVNAAHAIAECRPTDSSTLGNIYISTRQVGEEISIVVEDTGCGIPNELIDKIYDPFFTTKEVGKGTGQGLSIAYNAITRQHGGSISVESQPGTGTTFRIRIPIDGLQTEDQKEQVA